MFYKRAKVIVPPDIKPFPTQHELDAATTLSQYFHSPVEFLIPFPGYKMKTPDFVINGVAWELKCLFGNSRKSTVKFSIEHAQKQSHYIVIDSRHTKLTDNLIIRQLTRLFNQKRSIHRIILINKDNLVIDIKR